MESKLLGAILPGAMARAKYHVTLDKLLTLFARTIPHGHIETFLDEVQSHAAAHNANTDEPDLHFRMIFPLNGSFLAP